MLCNILYIVVIASITANQIEAFHSSSSSQHHRSSRLMSKMNPEASIQANDNTHASSSDNDISYSPPKRTKMDHSPNNDDKSQEDSFFSNNILQNDNTKAGAIYITVGPQCAGKTTILKQLLATNESTTNPVDSTIISGRDITIDDQALVYLKLPTPIYLIGSDKSPDMKATCDALYDQVVLGRSIIHRLSDKCMDELSWVMQRLGGEIDAEFFARRIRNEDEKKEEEEEDDNNTNDIMSKTTEKAQSAAQTSKKPRTTQDDLIDAVEYVIRTKTAEEEGIITNLLPETVDLFIVESIFRPRPLSEISQFAGNDYHRLRDLSKRNNNNNNNNNRHNNATTEASSALEDAQSTFQSLAIDSRQYPQTAPLSWGNTNTRPREMVTALDAAEKSHRPVHFIIYGGLEACHEIRNHTLQVDNDLTLCLPKSSRLTLLKRNICRFVETGRYIPCAAVSDALERVNSMVATAVAEANKEENNALLSSCCYDERANDAKFRIDYELAKLAGYQLHANRTVSCLSPSDNNNNNNNNRGNHLSGGRVINAAGRGRGRYNGGRNNYNRGRGQNNYNVQDYQRRDQYNNSRGGDGGGRGGGVGGRSYAHGSDGRGYNQGRGGGSYRNQNGGRGSSYNNNVQGRGGSGHHQGGRYSNQERYRGRNPNQHSEDTRISDGLEPRGNSSQYQRSRRGRH